MLAGSMAVSEQRLHPACDVFSLAAITYELVKGKPLLPVGSSLGEYRSRLSMLSGVDMSGVPGTLQVRQGAAQCGRGAAGASGSDVQGLQPILLSVGSHPGSCPDGSNTLIDGLQQCSSRGGGGLGGKRGRGAVQFAAEQLSKHALVCGSRLPGGSCLSTTTLCTTSP